MRAYEFITENFFFHNNYYEKLDCMEIIENIKLKLTEIDELLLLYKNIRTKLNLKIIDTQEFDDLIKNINILLPNIIYELVENKVPDFQYVEFIIEKLTKLQKEFSVDMAYFKKAIDEKRFNINQEIIKKLYKLIQHVDTKLQIIINRIANVAMIEKDI